jgi:hypothetical protein
MCEPEYIHVLTEGEERAARAGVPYVPTLTDLEAQAAADRDQEQADRDYRELARLVVRVVRCGCGEAECLACPVAGHLAAGP